MEKKITLSLRRCLLLAGTLALVSSCQDYEPFSDQQIQDVAYTHEFEKQFGEIDPRQDWDLFGQLARHIGPATRAGSDEIAVTRLDEEYVISQADYDNYRLILPELGNGGNTYQNSNLGRVTQDFSTVAHHIELIPVNWITTSTDRIGIYWFVDEDGPGVKTIMGKDDHMYYIQQYPIINDHKTNLEIVFEDANGNIKDRKPIGEDYHRINGSDTDGNPYTGDGPMYRDDVSANFLSQAQMNARGYAKQYLVAHPIKIDIPNSISEYGFYIENLGSDYFPYHYPYDPRYSKWELNPRAAGPIENVGKISYTATFNLSSLKDENGNPLYPDDKNQYLCFEDWIDNGDADLNDLVFIARGLDDKNIRDNNFISENALLVCEDLTKFDFDFNDVALELIYKEEDDRKYEWKPQQGNIAAHWEVVNVEAKERRLFVVPMAAGGAYETDIYVGVGSYGEIHTLMKEENYSGNPLNHAIINAGPNYQQISVDSIKYTLPMDYQWNVGKGQGQFATHLSQLFAEGFFRLHCKYDDKDATKIIRSGTINTNKNTPTAPQMMLLPTYFEWPQEYVHITEAYTGFSDWVSDITKTSWILDTQQDGTVTDRGDLRPEDPQEAIDPTLMEGIEVPIQYGEFIFDEGGPNEYPFSNAIFINLEGVEPLVLPEAKATLIVHYNNKPGQIYFDDNNGNELFTDPFGDGAPHVTYYTLSQTKFDMAVHSGGIWIMDSDDTPFTVSKVEIAIEGVTNPEKRHNLVVTPATLTFEELEDELPIVVSTSTHADISYSSSNQLIATVDVNGKVTSHSEGTCDIIVTAKKNSEYEANVARVKVVVDRTPTVNLTVGSPEPVYDYNPENHYYICHRNLTTEVDLSEWNNGATLVFHYEGYVSQNQPNFFRVLNPNGDVIAGNWNSYSEGARDITYTISGDNLDTCSDNGQYVFTIEYSVWGWNYDNAANITSASVTKIAN